MFNLFYKIVKKSKLGKKTAEEFWIKQETWILVKKVFWKELPRYLDWIYLKEIKDFNVNYLSGNTEISFFPKENWKYLLYFKWNYNYPYFVQFNVKDSFDKYDFKYKLDNKNLKIYVNSTYPFKKEETEKNIQEFFKQ